MSKQGDIVLIDSEQFKQSISGGDYLVGMYRTAKYLLEMYSEGKDGFLYLTRTESEVLGFRMGTVGDDSVSVSTMFKAGELIFHLVVPAIINDEGRITIGRVIGVVYRGIENGDLIEFPEYSENGFKNGVKYYDEVSSRAKTADLIAGDLAELVKYSSKDKPNTREPSEELRFPATEEPSIDEEHKLAP